jgi:glucose-6-phosphate isomerase
VQSVLWEINAFDQWGVELGKRLASVLIRELGEERPITAHDASTNGLAAHYQQLRKK